MTDDNELKRKQAWELSLNGTTLQCIAEELGITRRNAAQLVNRQRELNRKRLLEATS